jgi:hypothetical protein
MATSDASRADLFGLLERSVGRETASALMDHIPPTGWPDFATKSDVALLRAELHTDMAELRSELRSEVRTLAERFDGLEHRVELTEHRLLSEVDRRLRAQTWVHTSTLIAGLALVAAIGRVG